jgi:predicted RNase H-like nuclease (RuvC/YqgF family)
MVHRLIENEMEKRILENKCAAHESSLDTEMALNRSLRRQLTQLQRASQDSEWNLQEQVADLTNQLESERARIQRLHTQVTQLENQVNQQEHTNNTDNISNFGDNSPATSISVATTPAWRGDIRSLGSASWSAGSSRHQQDKLMRVAERLNITPNANLDDDHSVI